MHPIGLHAPEKIESTSEKFSKVNFLEARRKSWEALQEIHFQLKPGVTEPAAITLAASILKNMGSPRSWHRPIVRFGKNTCKTFTQRSDPTAVHEEGGAIMVDIGPTWKINHTDDSLEYEGDVGDTFAPKGSAVELCAVAARQLFREVSSLWREQKVSGAEIYTWLGKEATSRGYLLLEDINGHRLGDFPHHRFYKKGLASVTFTPASDVWMLEVQLVDEKREIGAFYEDLLT